jgi:hypothetical protein
MTSFKRRLAARMLNVRPIGWKRWTVTLERRRASISQARFDNTRDRSSTFDTRNSHNLVKTAILCRRPAHNGHGLLHSGFQPDEAWMSMDAQLSKTVSVPSKILLDYVCIRVSGLTVFDLP